MNAAEQPLESAYERIAQRASALKLELDSAEFATLAEHNNLGAKEIEAIEELLVYLSEKRHDSTIKTMLRLSRLPLKEPKTFESFDFSRIQGKDADALSKLPALSNLYAHKNLAFIGPGGIGKTHLAQAYGRECCIQGWKTYYLKATELRDKFEKACATGKQARAVDSLFRPSCLIIDEVGRCTFNRECTNLFFDVIDRRYEKEGPNTLILTSNTPVVNWDEFFTGDETLLCALDRIFDKASVFIMKGASYRGAECETYSVEAKPSLAKVSK